MPDISFEKIEEMIKDRVEASSIHQNGKTNHLFQGSVGPKAKELDEIMKELEDTPLFMKSLPEDAESHETLNALQALAYEGEPQEIAENFKNQGNDCFREGPSGYHNAISYYTKGLEVKCGHADLNSVLYCNRAAVNLELKNYRRVLNDCAKAIALNEKNVKAYFRSAKACLALDKVDEAMDCLERGLKLDPNNTAMLNEVGNCEKRKITLLENQERRQKLILEKQKQEETLLALIRKRGIQVQRSVHQSKMNCNSSDRDSEDDDEGFLVSASNYVDPSETSLVPGVHHPQAGLCRVHLDQQTNTLKWPVLFLYPEYKESDFIAEFDEKDTFRDHLSLMFPKDQPPLPWDKRHEYVYDHLQVYFECKQFETDFRGAVHVKSSSLFKVDPDMSLLDVLESEKYVVTDGVPCFIILVKSKTNTFTKKFRRRYTR